MKCRICNGEGTFIDMYHNSITCIHCNGSGIGGMNMNNEDMELVPFKAPGKVKGDNNYKGLLEQLQQNCTEGKETITFTKEDWGNVLSIVEQVETQIDSMSSMTPVAGPHGLCKATVCQWNALDSMRNKASKDAKKVERLYKAVEAVLQLIDNLVAERLLSAETWWVVQAGKIRSAIDDMKRE